MDCEQENKLLRRILANLQPFISTKLITFHLTCADAKPNDVFSAPMAGSDFSYGGEIQYITYENAAKLVELLEDPALHLPDADLWAFKPDNGFADYLKNATKEAVNVVREIVSLVGCAHFHLRNMVDKHPPTEEANSAIRDLEKVLEIHVDFEKQLEKSRPRGE